LKDRSVALVSTSLKEPIGGDSFPSFCNQSPVHFFIMFYAQWLHIRGEESAY